jgi:hypothetical protein
MPLSFALVPLCLSTTELLVWVSAEFSLIGKKAASKKNGRARARVHIAYTTFPQAAKSRRAALRVPQLHAFVRENRAALRPQECNRSKKLENDGANAVEK